MTAVFRAGLVSVFRDGPGLAATHMGRRLDVVLQGSSPASLARELDAHAMVLEQLARDARNAALRLRGYAPPPEVVWERRAQERRRMMRRAEERAGSTTCSHCSRPATVCDHCAHVGL